ncbi:hypothetical protein KY337_00240 [Candidatus Woesearchaeota archaeon]|nr:hypothetical protein [Candidatus Woesearchaeota archaeon]
MLEGVVTAVERKGWQVYNSNLPENNVPYTFADFERMQPVKSLDFDNSYRIFPITPPGALAKVMHNYRRLGISPALILPYEHLPESHRSTIQTDSGMIYYAHSLLLQRCGLTVMAVRSLIPVGKSVTALKLPCDEAEEYFQNYFDLLRVRFQRFVAN